MEPNGGHRDGLQLMFALKEPLESLLGLRPTKGVYLEVNMANRRFEMYEYR
jgi:hypothetical protein